MMVVPEPPDATEGRPESLLGPDDIAFHLELTAAQMKDRPHRAAVALR